ncbi:carboxymuconolactone decarboxylase family protein [Methylophilus sp. QUAN]|uniref:carboxymuconolactone decarboxylase family protein n=1 Tax=Methylophilus sp. QUAN TaxID=2781020 RepID=UPI00189011AC|nr:carboxymuconolactone decarboxylase family protein [Methylophilus sp. QUAN]MBF4991843.1 carboxymuconolactone decarboxylase family protein [Methylophilus sp. QUAN]
MQRTASPTLELVPAESKPTLDLFTNHLGFTPNMLMLFAQSPIAFNAWFGLRTALNRTLDMKTREAISLIVSEVNGCNYCLAVHTYAANLVKMPAEEIILARKGMSNDPKRDAAVKFARKVIEQRGIVTDAEFKAIREADFSEANILEIISLVAMFSLTNFFNNVFDPEKDYPPVPPAGSL